MDDKELIQMGRRVRDVREQRGCNVNELARRTEMSESTIRNIERGKSKITLETAIKLVKGLSVSLDYIAMGIRPQRNTWGLVLHSDDELEAAICVEEE